MQLQRKFLISFALFLFGVELVSCIRADRIPMLRENQTPILTDSAYFTFSGIQEISLPAEAINNTCRPGWKQIGQYCFRAFLNNVYDVYLNYQQARCADQNAFLVDLGFLNSTEMNQFVQYASVRTPYLLLNARYDSFSGLFKWQQSSEIFGCEDFIVYPSVYCRKPFYIYYLLVLNSFINTDIYFYSNFYPSPSLPPFPYIFCQYQL